MGTCSIRRALSQNSSQPQTAQGNQRGGNQRGGDTANNARDGAIGGFRDFVENTSPTAPLTGDGFRDWSDRLRDVEELVTDADLRWQATRIRQAARDMRTEFKKHVCP